MSDYGLSVTALAHCLGTARLFVSYLFESRPRNPGGLFTNCSWKGSLGHPMTTISLSSHSPLFGV